MKKLFFLFIMFVLAAGCRSESEQALNKGNELLNSRELHNWEKSVAYFKKSIELEVRARNQLARAYRKIAWKQMSEADKKMPMQDVDKKVRSLVHVQLGISYISLRLFNHALSNLEAAARIIPNDKMLHYYRGICYSQLSRSRKDEVNASLYQDKALGAYRKVLRIEKGHTKAMYGTAMIYLAKKNFKAGMAVIKELIVLRPKNRRAYFAKARFYFELKEYSKAERTYRMLLEMLPYRSKKRKVVKQNIRRLELLYNR